MSPAEMHAGGEVAPVFAALGDPTRLELVARLADRQAHSITSLGDGLPLSRQAVRKHLHVLEDAGVIVGERSGREHRFRVRQDSLAPAQQYLERVAAQWEDAALRLKAFIEDNPGDTDR